MFRKIFLSRFKKKNVYIFVNQKKFYTFGLMKNLLQHSSLYLQPTSLVEGNYGLYFE